LIWDSNVAGSVLSTDVVWGSPKKPAGTAVTASAHELCHSRTSMVKDSFNRSIFSTMTTQFEAMLAPQTTTHFIKQLYTPIEQVKINKSIERYFKNIMF
jgi:hypothetical protein